MKFSSCIKTVAISFFFFSSFSCLSQIVFYVDSERSSNLDGGRSWETAFKDLQPALDSVNAGTEEYQIWIKNGIYKPTKTPRVPSVLVPQNRHLSFLLSNSVKIYGGFSGSETTISERDSTGYDTILSGDILGDDIIEENANGMISRFENIVDNSNNTFVISSMSKNIELNSLKFIGGRGWTRDSESFDFANSYYWMSRSTGCAINYVDDHTGGPGGSFVLQNISFEYNVPNLGALYVRGYRNSKYRFSDLNFSKNVYSEIVRFSTLSPIVCENLLFKNNSGGELIATGSVSTTINNSIFINNSSSYGGLLRVVDNQLTVSNSIFKNNRARNTGLFELDEATSTIRNSVFTDNVCSDYNYYKGQGGIVYLHDNSKLVMENNVFYKNTASEGGVIYNYRGNAFLKSNYFLKNGSSSSHGTVIFNRDTLTVINNIFEQNGNNNSLGAVYNVSKNSTLDKNIFANNQSYEGSGLYDYIGSSKVTNNLFLGNFSKERGAALVSNSSSTQIINNSFIGNYSNSGGGVTTVGNTPHRKLINNLFYGNYGSNQSDVFWNVSIDSCFSNATDNISSRLFSFDLNTINLNNNSDFNVFNNVHQPLGHDGRWATADDGFSLNANSVLVSRGTFLSSENQDLTFRSRGLNPSIGAYEKGENDAREVIRIDKGSSVSVCPNTLLTLELSGCTERIKWLGGNAKFYEGSQLKALVSQDVVFAAYCGDNDFRVIEVNVIKNDRDINEHLSILDRDETVNERIQSRSKIFNSNFTSNLNVNYRAEKSITLLPGFLADKNSTFEAEIVPTCSN